MLIAVVLLFLFSIGKFSRQVQIVSGDKLKSILADVTATPLKGTVIGAILTSIIQSSTATTVMLVGLVNAGLVSFYNSLGIVFGANIGTTITSQLLAFNFEALAPLFVVAGFIIDKIENRWKRYGKSLFYFGLVFLCFALIEIIAAPFQSNQTILNILEQIDGLTYAILAGAVLSTVFQSSTVTTGIVITLAVQGLLSLEQSFGIVLGANIGTTSTALIASLVMDRAAKQTAVAHFLFNVIGVVIIIPLFVPFLGFVGNLSDGIASRIANAHLIFNLASAAIFLVFIKSFSSLVRLIVK